MAYNLPPPWDSGYALPQNVEDEGLERRGFITKWMPRGTYDDATDGTGGYAVPQYVLNEGIGQGTFTTKWMPSGSYVGPKVKHWLNARPKLVQERPLPGGGKVVTVQPLGDDQPLPAPIEDYGTRAAQALIARVAPLPAGKREAALRLILAKIDKSLWSRTQTIWNRYRAQGMPPAQAFPQALARALSAGMAAEIVMTGLRGSAPQAKSLLGLGCYGCMAALGADEPATMCPPAPGFTWVAATTDVPGHWERLRKGATPVNGPCDPATGGTITPVTADHRTQYMQVGPFLFPVAVTRVWGTGTPGPTVANIAAEPDVTVTDPARIPDDWVPWLVQELTQAVDKDGKKDTMVTDYVGSGASGMYGYPEADAGPWFQRLGINPGQTPLRMHMVWGLRTGINPFAKLAHPTTGENLVLHVILARRDRTKDWNATTNPTVLKLYLSRVPDPSLFTSIWNSLVTLVGVIRDVAADALEDLADLACGLISGPQGTLAGAAAAGAAGAPPQAGAAGAAIAQQACGAKPPPPVPIIPAPSILPMALLAGGAVLAVALLSTPRKKKTP